MGVFSPSCRISNHRALVFFPRTPLTCQSPHFIAQPPHLHLCFYSAASSIQINDFEFCSAHGKEVCNDCGIDTLEDNDFVAGIDHVEGREPIEVAFAHNKNGEVVCKKHSAKNDSCFAFKKQIVKVGNLLSVLSLPRLLILRVSGL